MIWWHKVLKKIGVSILKNIHWIASGVAAAIILHKVSMLLSSKEGRVDKPQKFTFVPKDDSKIIIKDNEKKEWVEVQLPSGVKYEDVEAAGFASGEVEVRVEVKHEMVDRRNISTH